MHKTIIPILNVITTEHGIINQIHSYPISENPKHLIEAKNMFYSIALRIGAEESDLLNHYENGYYIAGTDCSVAILPSNVTLHL